MDKNILAVALGSMLLGGVAVAAYSSFNDRAPIARTPLQPVRATADIARFDAPPAGNAVRTEASLAPALPIQPIQPRLEYADVVHVDPVKKKQARYATVIDTDAVRETSTTSVPREVCNDVVVQERLPERDGNVGGTVAGALIGGLVGSRVGDGNGRRAATAAGAVAGGFIGNRVDRNHVGGRVIARTDRQCRTVTDTAQSSRVIGYNVTFRNSDGTIGTMRRSSRPGGRIMLGNDSRTVGYDVTYRYRGIERTVRMSERPASRLPVVDGQVVSRSALAGTVASRG